jgi:hypothetical protein
MVGLSRRITVPDNVSSNRAKELKIKMQERVMELWNEHQASMIKTMDMERLLQILECLAEDELFMDDGIEIE